MVDGDDRDAAADMTSTYSDKPIPQFWDGELLLGKEVSRSLSIEPERAAWDIYLFYPPGAEWTDAGLPLLTADVFRRDLTVDRHVR